MDIRKLQRAIVDGLEDVKAQDIKVFDTSHLTELFDRVVIASGTSNRQTKALAASVRDTVKDAGGHIIAVEGLETGEWVLVDCGDAVVHIMQPQLRLYYNLEEIWGGKPVRLKLSSSKGLVKASEPLDGEDEDEVPAARGLRRASSLRPALARLPEGMKEPSPPMGHEDTDPDAIATMGRRTPRTTSAGGAAPAKKVAAKKAPARKTSTTATTATRSAAPRKTAAAKTTTTARKTATKTAAKPATRAATKTAAAKSPARKRSA